MKKVKLLIIVAGIVLLAVCTGVVVVNRSCVYLPLEKAYFEDSGTLYGVSQPLREYLLQDSSDVSKIEFEGNMDFLLFTKESGAVVPQNNRYASEETLTQIFLLDDDNATDGKLYVTMRDGTGYTLNLKKTAWVLKIKKQGDLSNG
jgi:hypothetical protein